MGVPASRESRVERGNIESDLVKLVGRRCATWVRARLERDVIELIHTRDYIPLQTAFYAKWLLFRDEAAATAFLEAWPRYRMDERLAKLDEERQALALKLQQRLKRGDFNLGRIGDDRQRENLAHRYVETATTLRGLGSQRRLLETAEGAAHSVAGQALNSSSAILLKAFLRVLRLFQPFDCVRAWPPWPRVSWRFASCGAWRQ